MTYCFDIDGTLCTDTKGCYSLCKPLMGRVEYVKYLYAAGHTIVLHTARSPERQKFTIEQLSSWGIPYHKLQMGKPKADLYIDNQGVSGDEFFSNALGE